jgi:hypothetical protein
MPVPLPGWLPDDLYVALGRLGLRWPPDEESLGTAYRRRSLQCHPVRAARGLLEELASWDWLDDGRLEAPR